MPSPPPPSNSTSQHSPLEVDLGFCCLALLIILVFGSLVAFFLRDKINWTHYLPFLIRFKRQAQVILGAPVDLGAQNPPSPPSPPSDSSAPGVKKSEPQKGPKKGSAPGDSSAPSAPGIKKSEPQKGPKKGESAAKKGNKKKTRKPAKPDSPASPASPPSVAKLPADQQP